MNGKVHTTVLAVIFMFAVSSSTRPGQSDLARNIPASGPKALLSRIHRATKKSSVGMGRLIGDVSLMDKNPADDFVLTDQEGRPFHLSQERGKAVLLFFGYTHCPDACPTTMSKLSRVYKLLGANAEQVVTLFVSVDTDRDTPSVLKSYLAYFHLNSLGLTGTKARIDAVVNQYGAKYEIEKSDSAAGYHINHSTDLYLLDQKGQLANRFKYSDGTQIIVDGVRRLIH
jgi:protein SCO1/2